MNKKTVGSLFAPLGRLLAKFHMTLFIVFIVAGLSAAVLFLNQILTDTSMADGYTSPIDPGSIDQATLERLRALHTSNEPLPDVQFPEGRINPFGE